MNRNLLYIFILFSISCKQDNAAGCLTSTGNDAKEIRLVDEFSALEIYDNFEVRLFNSSSYEVRIFGGKNLIKSIGTEVNNKKLIIENNNKCNWVRNFNRTIKVDIYSPIFSELTYYGHNIIQAIDTLITDTLLVNLWECSGDVKLLVKCDYLELKSNTGTGTINCEGKTRELVSYMGGNGFINSFNCTADQVLAVNENTGKLQLNANSTLKVDLRSRGNVEYTGYPIIIENIEGSGKLINVN